MCAGQPWRGRCRARQAEPAVDRSPVHAEQVPSLRCAQVKAIQPEPLRFLKEMNILSARQSSNPICPATESVSRDVSDAGAQGEMDAIHLAAPGAARLILGVEFHTSKRLCCAQTPPESCGTFLVPTRTGEHKPTLRSRQRKAISPAQPEQITAFEGLGSG